MEVLLGLIYNMFKVGDRCTIVNNDGNIDFNIGDIIVIKKIATIRQITSYVVNNITSGIKDTLCFEYRLKKIKTQNNEIEFYNKFL